MEGTTKLPFRAVWLYRALIVAVSSWLLHSYLQAILAACITAVGSWPLYVRFRACLPERIRRDGAPLLFTGLIAAFVLAPLMFACVALMGEARALLLDVAAADQRGIALPGWLESLPLLGPWAMARYQSELAHPGALMLWAQRTDPAVLLGWVQAIGRFTVRHAFIITFTTLLLFFLYRQGEEIARGWRLVLRQTAGASVDRYIGLGIQAVRASVNSMLVVAMFDGLAAAIAYTLAGVPKAMVWGAITGALGLVPFLGYAAVLALALQLALKGTAGIALAAAALGCSILLFGDKVVRPVVAGGGVRLPFVWVLIGCLAGFEVLGIVGLVVGPVVLTLVRELWEQRVHDAAANTDTSVTSR